MKGKKSGKIKTKGSLHKTSSTVINLHTHRNSIISDSIPLHYNQSILSIRASSLHRSKNNEVAADPKCSKFISQNKFGNKKILLRQVSSNHYSKKKQQIKQHYLKSKRSNISREKKNERSSMHSQNKKINKNHLALTQSMYNCLYEQKEEKYSNLNEVLKRSTQLLNNYRVYTENLRTERDKYKQKYKEVMTKLKKYEGKQK